MTKINQLTPAEYQEAFNYLMEGDHQLIIYGVLKRLNIQKSHPQYDDLVQEGCLSFVQIYHKYPKAKQTKAHLNYIYQGIKWQIINRLNFLTYQNQHIEISDDDHDPLLELIDPHSKSETQHALKGFIQHLYQICDVNERKYIREVYNQDLTVAEMAAHYHVARKLVYAWRKRVAQKAQAL